MGKGILDVIRATVDEIQQKNRNNPMQETADPSVFDLLKGKLRDIETQGGRRTGGGGQSQGGPENILDLIKDRIEEARRENRDDPNQRTAPGSIFDQITKRVEGKQKRRVRRSIKTIIEEYSLDVRGIPRDMLLQIEQSYGEEAKQLDEKYARGLHEAIQRAGR